MSICLVDTSIFCNVLDVPNRNQQRDAVLAQLRQYIQSQMTLLLPVTAIIETGNHIAQQGDGGMRRAVAQRFVTQVQQALDGTAPWIPTPVLDLQQMHDYLNTFPNYAMQGVGIGDLLIIKEFEHQCLLHRSRRVFIWSIDNHLAAYDRI
ncbi:hypothetical protein [Candidatus Oscillochloris fontis]|uniref:hypothetical protein n=1 Tax=Candidatus Oscillochloris fontis TaxID=2496868 RepID=UPI00101B7FDA|nr:hypothetical protein [Candidatus Oscillochloris fontis]